MAVGQSERKCCCDKDYCIKEIRGLLDEAELLLSNVEKSLTSLTREMMDCLEEIEKKS